MIRLERVSFSFGAAPILDDASLLVPEGARVGLVGRNGAGKTTLFRLILGSLAPEVGSIDVPRGRRVVYLPQHPDLPPRETILRHVLESHASLRDLEDEILRLERKMADEHDPARLDRLVERHRTLSRELEAQGGYDLEARVSSILEALGFARGDLLKELGLLSPGEKNRVALAKVLLAEGDVLLLDEPTNHLDFDSIEWVEDFLRAVPPGISRVPATVVVASHDRWFLNRFADRILELRSGGLFAYSGGYDAFVRQRAEELERQEKEYVLRERQIAKDEEFIRRNFAAQKARQAKSREKRLARLERLSRPQREGDGPAIRFGDVPRAGDDVLRVEGLSCGYGKDVLLSDVWLELERGERVALVGANGSGKTTFLKCLTGHIAPLEGTVRRGQRTITGYYEQEHSHIGTGKPLFDEIHDLVPQRSNQDVRDLLAAFLFRGDDAFRDARDLSGGEKARVALLRLLLSGANLLVLDEPTNHLDVYARAALEESLLEFPGTMLFVSHDRYFVDRLADRVFAVHEGSLREFLGGYEEWRSVVRERRAAAASAEARAREARVLEARVREASGPSALSPARRRKEEERFIEAITALEDDLRRKREECGLEANYRSPEAMRRLKAEISDLEARVEGLYRRWEAESPGGA
ncbi:MAG: ABC-F family ATP-binding cassette domain-containing protein [Planctomycetes bacterium]|nr:ABC-F family ATP-binding cassette domain-containing protein [Planctomycetota bacterium]